MSFAASGRCSLDGLILYRLVYSGKRVDLLKYGPFCSDGAVNFPINIKLHLEGQWLIVVYSFDRNLDIDQQGLQMHQLMTTLYPICRSITGNGLRESLQAIQKYIPLELREVPTGTQVFDWIVPKEWNVRDAYVKNAKGDKVIDFKVL